MQSAINPVGRDSEPKIQAKNGNDNEIAPSIFSKEIERVKNICKAKMSRKKKPASITVYASHPKNKPLFQTKTAKQLQSPGLSPSDHQLLKF